jgi:hypothetical protein
MSETTKTEQGLTTLDQFQVPDIITQLDNQIKKIGNIETSSYRTNMILSDFGNLNLKEVKNLEDLVKAHSYIRGKALRYNESLEELGIQGTAKPFTEDGYSLEEWTQDILLQVNILTHKERLIELKKLKKEAEQFISAEDKKRMFLMNLMNNPHLKMNS